MALSARNGSKPSAHPVGSIALAVWGPFGPGRRANRWVPSISKGSRSRPRLRALERSSSALRARSFTLARASETFGLAGVGGAHRVDGDANQHAALLLHGAAILVPVGMLPTDAPVVVDQPLHRLGQRHDLRPLLDLDPAAEEVIGQDAQNDSRVASQVARLVGALPGRDDQHPLAVDPNQDGRGLQPPTGPSGDQHRPVVAGHERSWLVGAHTPPFAAQLSRSYGARSIRSPRRPPQDSAGDGPPTTDHARPSALIAPRQQTRPGSFTTVHRVRKRPRTIRLLRQAATAAILQLDLEHPAALATGRCDRLLDPATLHPQHHLTPAEQHHPRCLLAAATGIAADLHPVRHATTSGFI